MENPERVIMGFVHKTGAQAIIRARYLKKQRFEGVRITVALKSADGLPERKFKGYLCMWHSWCKDCFDGKVSFSDIPKNWTVLDQSSLVW